MSFGVYAQFQTFGQSQELESILKNKNPTLEELLDRDNFLFDIKAGALNTFIEYLWKQPESLEKMIHYIIITNEHIEDNDKNRKYPYIISEIFALENSKLIDLFFTRHRSESQLTLSNERTTIEDDILPEYIHHEDTCKEDEDPNSFTQIQQVSGTSIQCASFKSKSGHHLNENLRLHLLSLLFKYLETPNINDTSMGYYAKFLLMVTKRYGGELWDHIMSNSYIITDMLQHIHHYQIVEVVVQLIILDFKLNDNILINYHYYNVRKQLLEEMVSQLNKFQENYSMVSDICSIVELLLDEGIQLKLYEHLKDIYDIILKPLFFFQLAKKTKLKNAYIVVQKIIGLIHSNNIQDQKTSDLVQIIKQINSVIQQNLQQDQNISFGINNLLLVQIIEYSNKLNNPFITESMFESQIFKSVFDYAIQFQWNNQLHLAVQNIIQSKIMQDQYCQRVITEIDLLQKIKNQLIENPFQTNYKFKYANGYNGLLKQLAFKLLQKYNTKTKINQTYIEYQNLMEEISKLLAKESTYLCEVDPKTHMQDAPPEISIDRQIEMIIDAQKEKEDQLQKQYTQNQEQ